MIRPHAPSAPDRYSRLFQPFDDPLPTDIRDQKLTALAENMKSNQSPIPLELLKSDPVGAGYTYFGQFIDHDLTEDRTAFRSAGLVEPKDTENRRTPWLNLDNLYGHGPGCPVYRDLYDADGVSFRLGEPKVHGEAFDVPLTDGWPQLADSRNSENLIVRQIHAMFLKLHNLAVAVLKRTEPLLGNPANFAKARQTVTWQYQWLVRHDLLRRLCQERTYEEVVVKRQYGIDWRDGFSIPIEFSQAAFRFGHSMVRPDYKLNDDIERVGLDMLFAEHRPGEIEPRFAVDWAQFLDRREFSMRIDTAVAEPLFSLPDASVHLFVNASGPHSSNALPVRTLLRGAANRLPTGQQARERFCPTATLSPPQIVPNHPYNPWTILNKLELSDRIPLWYYILLEAELNENGLRLGEVGSRLVLEVIEGALLADPDSFLTRFGSGWEPPPWDGPNRESFPIRTLLDVATVVGLRTTKPR